MSGFVCWGPDYEDDPGEAAPDGNRPRDVLSVEGAAEAYAERLYDDGDPFEEVVVMVRDIDGIVHRVKVTVSWSPTFYADAEKA
jgi:hypothetical protein